MFEWWSDITLFQRFYWIVAVIATTLLLLIFILSVFGSEVDVEADFDADLDAPDGLWDLSIISIKSILAFLTMFGWTGVIMGANLFSTRWIIIGSILLGFSALFLVGYLTKFLQGMSESGNLDLKKLLNRTAKVYLTIPGESKSTGKVHVLIEGSLKEYDARTQDDAILSGELVRIVAVEDNQVMVVEKV